jgi:hypothetical protein
MNFFSEIMRQAHDKTHTKSEQQKQMWSDLKFMTISLQSHTKTLSKLRFKD